MLTGYLPSAAHVGIAEDLIARVRANRADALVVCDPVLGDDPDGLFMAESVAEAVRDKLLPLADVVKANRFELAWLTGRAVASPESAVAAARSLGRPVVVASSVPYGGERAIANVVVTPDRAAFCAVEREDGVPRGTGDLLGALLTGHIASGRDAFESLAHAAFRVARMIDASRSHPELQLADAGAWQASGSVLLTEIAG